MDQKIDLNILLSNPEWSLAHLLGIIVYLEDRFGSNAGETISKVAQVILDTQKVEK